ncbi:RING-type E3 ubiquitin transferase [Purpureocillium takamizusanense]|uniref:RING-type E3 ubiquitin transferase n=1 Tax=Purpureocillium takamizusanense TaxID=2060973 RepID=A0A9Q8VBN1_9HYPO|nr:RING-type E3 ubiquitin transferase [Purpureocillium takamizusanense]UNI19116.1 RING-type E3 ubiquitin transferase [Purpureocillium takamizusanense]
MPRTKVTARRPKPFRPDSKVGIDDPIPAEVVQYILAIPSSSAGIDDATESSAAEPPNKRLKLDPRPDLAISVAKSQVSFRRPCTEDTPKTSTKTFHDVEGYLRIGLSKGYMTTGIPLRDGTLQGRGLALSSPSTSPIGKLDTLIALRPREAAKQAIQIFDTPAHSIAHNEPGRLWKAMGIAVECDGKMTTVTVALELFWNSTPSPFFRLRRILERKDSQAVINAFYPTVAPDKAWSPMDFYDAAFVPPKDDSHAASIEVPGLEATLFPYQKRTLKWLLAREGMEWDAEESRLRPLSKQGSTSRIDTFRDVRDSSGDTVFVSDVFQTITRDKSLYEEADRAIKGGILAEEMGLGKTLEILGLILLNSCMDLPTLTKDPKGRTSSRATLIVTPESLRQQWVSEMARHAPSLRVKHYEGCKKLQGEEDDIVQDLAEHDIVITTYSVLSAEVHFAQEPPKRPRRYERAYPRMMSPLVKISWWRLCLDEAQMIENGYSQAAIVARALPRVNSWGITGTPVKDDVKDLLGLLSFLGYEPYCSASHVWQALINNHKPVFQQIFRAISLRHTKALVRDEIMLPPQKRYVISMPFTAVEEQHYQSLFKEMAEECGFDLEGSPVDEHWEPEKYEDAMRVWLNRLRQTTLHPEVGVYSRRLLGSNKNRPMRTVDEVLNAMLEQSENAIRNDERAYISSRLTRGQLYENSPRVKVALDIWEQVRAETEKLVADARVRLTDAIRDQGGEEAVTKAESNDLSDLSESEAEHEDGENKGRISECRRRLRSSLELHHKAVFFCANAYFQIRDNAEMTEPESEEFKRLKKLEDEGYDQAKVIRREILRESNRKATRLMNKIKRRAANQQFTEIPELVIKSEKGLESARVVENLEDLYGELNDQANVVDEWREEVVQLLLRPLVDEEDEVETTGEELADSAKFQDLLMVYYQTLRAAIADRQDAITGQTNELVKHETETSIRLAKEGDGPAPEKLLEMLAKRAEVKPGRAQKSMRAAISDLRGLQTRLTRDTAPTAREAVEARIVAAHMTSTHAQLTAQNKAAAALESEIESFKTAMNTRLEYYRQLQAVSDAVLPYEGSKTDEAIAKMAQQEEDMRRKLSSAEAKHRYLLNLKEAGSKSNEPRMCVICQMPFTIGVLTVCGHQFCKECMTMWFKAHHNCPVCKRALKPSNLHDITIKPQQLQVTSEPSSSSNRAGSSNAAAASSPQQRRGSASIGPAAAPRKSAIYAEFNADQLAEIKNVDLDGPSFTTKVDTLVRHLVWLRESDPGAKSIVFSQYRDFLTVLRNAFRRFHIGHASIDEHAGIAKFKEDPAVEVFLLHARAHSSGLNLVNASHVFLCEPLLNTALELQAIARVDRIGQQHETTVWLYLVSGTVEESIHNLSVRRRMEHMGGGRRRHHYHHHHQDHRPDDANDREKEREATPEQLQLLDASIEAANTLELEHAALSRLMSKDRSAGEVVDKGDLWECLFGRPRQHVAAATGSEGVTEANSGSGGDGGRPIADPRLRDKAVMGYLAGEAAEQRRT